jgi:hypothetical protein
MKSEANTYLEGNLNHIIYETVRQRTTLIENRPLSCLNLFYDSLKPIKHRFNKQELEQN